MTEPSLVSVVIPTFNRTVLLRRALASLQRQTFRSFEVIVVDDGSDEDISAVVASVGDQRFRLLRSPTKGAAGARNLGAREARGKYLAFLDSDDEAMPHWLEKMCAALTDDGARIVCCGNIKMDSGGNAEPKCRLNLPRVMGPVFGNAVGHFTAGAFLLSRQRFLEIGGYDEDLLSGHHTELAMRLLSDGAWGVCSIFEPLIKVHVHEGPRIRNNARAVYEGTTYILNKHAHLLALCRKTLARYHDVAGVSAARVGMYREAKLHFGKSVSARRTSPKRWARLIVSQLPGLMWLLWGRVPKATSEHRA